MALKKWIRCCGGKVHSGKACRDEAKFIAIESDEEGELKVPVCNAHGDGYSRLLEVTPDDVEKYGKM